MPVRYSQLDYVRPIIINGTMEVADMPFDRLSASDLAVAVKGDRIRVVKDRYGEPCEISKAQLEDIRVLDPEVIDLKGAWA